MQVADATFDVLGIPPEIHRWVILLALSGFPFALVLGWVFDWTADGVVRTSSADLANVPAARSRDVDLSLAVVATVAVGAMLWMGLRDEGDTTTGPVTSIVVLPFDDLSPEGGRAYFAEGMAGRSLKLRFRHRPDLRF